jgi:ArsR family transcriptional regulator
MCTRSILLMRTYVKPYIFYVTIRLVMVKRDKPFDRELFFRALADPTRLRIINLIGEQEVCVCFFVEILKTNQPKVSRHLAYLRRAGIVAARREGIWMHYRISTPKDENAARVLTDVREWLAKDPEMQHDRNRLHKICCAAELPVQLQGSPRPTTIGMSA